MQMDREDQMQSSSTAQNGSPTGNKGRSQKSKWKGAHPCTSSSGQGGGKRVLEDFF